MKLIALVIAILTAIYRLLPDSIFQSYFADVDLDFLPYLNWFIPFDRAVEITTAWVVLIAAYYLFDEVRSFVNNFIVDKILK